MTVYFGLEFDDRVYPPTVRGGATVAVQYCGESNFLRLLEIQTGLTSPNIENEHLRIEQFRQVIAQELALNPNQFYEKSFRADAFATAKELLTRRDELLLAGWDFKNSEKTPFRLKSISNLYYRAAELPSDVYMDGFADRFLAVEKILPICGVQFSKIFHHEPYHLLPSWWQRVFKILESKGVAIAPIAAPFFASVSQQTDLQYVQSVLSGNVANQNKKTLADGSLLVIKAKRETEAATFLARLLIENPTLQPLCLVPEKNRALDNAFAWEGLASLGILSDSSARPMLQILKLASSFLWKPIDPFKIMEFLSMPLKPLPVYEVTLVYEPTKVSIEGEEISNSAVKTERTDLSRLIAREMAQTPGIQGERWQVLVKKYFEALDKEGHYRTNINAKEARRQYDFWFERERYDQSREAPISEAVKIYREVARWAWKAFEEQGGRQNSLLVLGKQAERVVELLSALPASEQTVSYLGLERVVRTVYEPSPVMFRETEVGAYDVVHQKSAIAESADFVLWWNFTDTDTEYFFSKWHQAEVIFLDAQGVVLDAPAAQHQRRLWQRLRPVLRARERLWLIVPEYINGKAVQENLLMSDLAACFEDLNAISIKIDEDFEKIQKIGLKVPKYTTLKYHNLSQKQLFIQLPRPNLLKKRLLTHQESYSSLELLFYYPYKWLFQYAANLKKSPILTIVKEHTLMGNLAHRVIEELFKKERVLEWESADIMNWVSRRTYALLAREGATLLMYGKEPEKTAFMNSVRFAASGLVQFIRGNGWSVQETELRVHGKLGEVEMSGVADLVLTNEKEEIAVIDLKWRGESRRKDAIRNNEDLQLVIYSGLLRKEGKWAHTAYYILENGRLIARNNAAFKDAIVPKNGVSHEPIHQMIWEQMINTYNWRKLQTEKGEIEVRTEKNAKELEEIYLNATDTQNLLEMKDKDAPYNDFKTLVYLLV